MIEWIDLATFAGHQEILASQGKYIEENVSTMLSFNEIGSILETKPYYAEAEDIGKTVTWFGIINKQAFYVMNFPDSTYPKTILACLSHEILADLDELAAMFYKNITWINHYPAEAKFSVFSYDRNDIKVEVYRCETKEEADHTMFFLNTRGQTDTFFVDSAEEQNTTWLVIEERTDGNIEIGRYVDRLSAEYFAKDYRETNNTKIRLEQIR
jgi:hypothetical protein